MLEFTLFIFLIFNISYFFFKSTLLSCGLRLGLGVPQSLRVTKQHKINHFQAKEKK